MTDAQFKEAFNNLATDVASTLSMENALSGKGPLKFPKPRGRGKKSQAAQSFFPEPRNPSEIAKKVLAECNEERKRSRDNTKPDISDRALSKAARFTDKFNLKPYEPFLHYVPRLVNVVTLAEAIPVKGSGISLPLDLHRIAARCKNSFYAPKKFSAVQLAYSEPRCRVLIFHTGRMVGTGTQGPMAARLALLRAQRQLYQDAGVHIHVRNFNVINQVGASSLRATLNCDEFASAHSSTAHYDSKSFVGLAWRPAGEKICCEVYSTGRSNLPGSTVERELQESFSRMLPELLRYSSASRLLSLIPKELQEAHRTDSSDPAPSAPHGQLVRAPGSLMWEGWADAAETGNHTGNLYNSSDEDDDLDLTEMGL